TVRAGRDAHADAELRGRTHAPIGVRATNCVWLVRSVRVRDPAAGSEAGFPSAEYRLARALSGEPGVTSLPDALFGASGRGASGSGRALLREQGEGDAVGPAEAVL